MSCSHVPHQDDRAIYVFEELLTHLVSLDPFNKLELIIAGDFLDCFDISKFDRIPNSQPSLLHEIETGRAFLMEWRRILGERKITYIFGNHEMRLRSFTARMAPEIYEIAPGLPQLLGLNELHIECVDFPPQLAKFQDNFIDFHGVLVGHMNKVRQHSAYTAKALVDDKGVSVVQGHTHRAGIHWKKQHNKLLFGAETGCLCSFENTYLIEPNWEQGMVVLTAKDGVVFPEALVLNDYAVSFGGRIFRG